MTQPNMRPRVGFLLLQDELNGRCGWVAGFYFIKNCLNAIASLPEKEIPPIFVFIPENFSEPLLNTHIANNKWLTLIKIPEKYLVDTSQHHMVEKIINSFDCQVYFPLLTIPRFVLKGPMIGWIPDFQEKHLPHFFNDEEQYARDSINSFISTYCERVLSISNSVSFDFEKYYPNQAGKCVVIRFRSCIDESYLEIAPTDTLEKYNLLHKKYILLPNQFWIHKNHKMVFEAWHHLIKMGCDFQLVCTGHHSDFRFPNYYNELISYLQENKLTDHIRIIGFIDRKEQIQLYRGASAVLQPSLFEGWNTSLEDAKALGKHVIVSDIPVHHEQCELNVYFFDPHNPYLLAETINHIWKSLPAGHDATAEQQAYVAYHHQINQFGQTLLSLFTNCIQSTHQNLDVLKLPVFLYRQLMDKQKICDERLALINALHNEMNTRLKKEPTKISIITPSFNQGEFIERTIKSVISQNNSFCKIEYIVIDGNSRDQTLSILTQYQSQIIFYSEPDRGQSHAINKGMQLGTGDVIGWLNADDIYYPDTLNKICRFFDEHPDVDVVYGDAKLIDHGDKPIGFYSTEPFSLSRLKARCILSQPAAFLRRSVILKYGMLDEQLHFCMDYEFWLRLGIRGAKFAYLPDVLAGARIYPETKSFRFPLKASIEAIHVVKKNLGYLPPEWLVSHAGAIVKQASGRHPPHYRFVISVWATLWRVAKHYQPGWLCIPTWIFSQIIMLKEFFKRYINRIKKQYRYST